ncbi:MAG: glycerol-3-phosphate 1-O-acyltransferase PlsY [Lachnospiraceae bacterium]|nr:glycerol-3-phosphate 1-O-acyltransferase PlsY [Lachnospiraceae bacterium]
MERVVCVIIGYLFGLFQTGYIYGKLNGVDIRTRGSGNSGTTNALRVMGRKAGFIVFCGDVLKLLLACYVTMALFNHGVFHTSYGEVLLIYTGLGTVLGHNYPCYLHWKGAKGIAVTAAMILVLDWRLVLIEATVFLLTVAVTRYVSLGSIFVVIMLFLSWTVMGHMGLLAVSGADYTESCVLLLLWAALAIWRHRSNIRRLIKGEENKLF